MLIAAGTAWNTQFCMRSPKQFWINRAGWIFNTNQLRKTHLGAVLTPTPGPSNTYALRNFKHKLVWQRPWGNIWYLLLLIEALLLGETHDKIFHQDLWYTYKIGFPVSTVMLRTCNRRGREGMKCPLSKSMIFATPHWGSPCRGDLWRFNHQDLWDNERGREGMKCSWGNLWYLLLLVEALLVGVTHDDLIIKISETYHTLEISTMCIPLMKPWTIRFTGR